MSTKALVKQNDQFPSLLDDFFKPWNDWFNNGFQPMRSVTMPAVNITDNKDEYKLSLAAPGLKKNDFNIDVDGNMLTISCEKEDNKEEKDGRHTRKEYSYQSFSRTFTIPEEVSKDKIDAQYEDGILKVTLPKKEDAKRSGISRHISVK